MSTEGFNFSADGKTLLSCDFSQLGTYITVPDGCTEIADKVFAESPVISVSLPDSVVKIGENLFSSCDTLQEVKLSNNLTELKPFTFAGCVSLKKVTISDKVTSFPAGLFFGCSLLESIPLKSINSLEVDVFRDCENITSVKIPEGVTEIKTGALTGCKKLSSIVFPQSLEKIADRSLAGLSSLTSMSFSGDNENFFVDEDSGCLYEMTDNGSVLIKCPVNQETIYLIENTCDCHIDAFEGCTSLAEVYASTDAPETLVNRLMELIPQIDINSYDESEMNAKASEEISSSSVDDILSQNDSSENSDDDSCPVSISLDDLKLAESKPVVDVNDILSQNSSSEETTSENKSDDQMDIDISEIINSQCIHNDDHAEGFRPISMDELEALMNKPPVDVSTMTENSQTPADNSPDSSSSDSSGISQSEYSSETETASAETPKRGRGRPRKEKSEEETNEDKPKRGRGRPRKEKSEEEIAAADKPKRGRGRPRKNPDSEETSVSEAGSTEKSSVANFTTTEEPVVQDFTYTEADEKDLNLSEKKSLLATASAKQTAPAQNTNTTDDSNEPRFLRAMKNVAHHQMVLEEKENEKETVYGEMKELIVFADGVAPSTDDFSSHLVKFSKDVAKKYGFTKIYFFEDLPLDNPEFMYGLKSFGNAKNILYACNKPCPEKISDDQKELLDATGIELPSDKLKNVKGTIAESGLDLPVKILVQDNYIEGLLYCAEKFRAEHGID